MKKIMFNDKVGQTTAVLDGRITQKTEIIKNSSNCDVNYSIDGGISINGNGCIYPKYTIGEVVAIAQCYKYMYTPAQIDENGNPYKIGTALAGWTDKRKVSASNCINHLMITNIRVERLQDITDEDCFKEGIMRYTKDKTVYKYDLYDGFEMFPWRKMKRTPRESYAALIDKMHGKGTWESNPMVFVYEFIN